MRYMRAIKVQMLANRMKPNYKIRKTEHEILSDIYNAIVHELGNTDKNAKILYPCLATLCYAIMYAIGFKNYPKES